MKKNNSKQMKWIPVKVLKGLVSTKMNNFK